MSEWQSILFLKHELGCLPVLVNKMLYNKQNTIWLLAVTVWISLLAFNSTSHLFAAHTHEISS